MRLQDSPVGTRLGLRNREHGNCARPHRHRGICGVELEELVLVELVLDSLNDVHDGVLVVALHPVAHQDPVNALKAIAHPCRSHGRTVEREPASHLKAAA
jgi:hypothetical protein